MLVKMTSSKKVVERNMRMSFLYKIASEQAEFDQIHQLNYQTFVKEIPQHERNEMERLIDRFHEDNQYIICLKDERLVGMICVRSNRPFSLDKKIGPVEKHLPISVNRPCEVRLLAVQPEFRNGRVFMGLAQALIRYCLKKGYDSALISGTTRQIKLYKQLGFQPFAYLTGEQEAQFQPMYLTKAIFDETVAGRLLKEPIHFLPGPVTISSEVQTAFGNSPISHRSINFAHILDRVKMRLQSLLNARHVQIFHGTGTLANDVVAAQLSLRNGKGLIIANGEFGSRLIEHGKRWRLHFDTLTFPWGAPYEKRKIEEQVTSYSYDWIWAVHCETSTGVLNDVNDLKNICRQHEISICLDCVSSIGAVPLDLEGVAFASGVSGKSIGSYTGLSFVFHQENVQPQETLPAYLDLGTYMQADGIPYSQSSNLLQALDMALAKYDPAQLVFAEVEKRYQRIRTRLEEGGIDILSSAPDSSPVIMTIALPTNIRASEVGEDLYLNGFQLHYESHYLRENNWLQISCINPVAEKEIDKMLDLLIALFKQKKLSKRDVRDGRFMGN